MNDSDLELILKNLKYSRQIIKDSLLYNALLFQKFDLKSSYETRKVLSFFLNHTKKEKLDEYIKGYVSLLKIFYDDNLVVGFFEKVHLSLEKKAPLTLGDLAINGEDILIKFPKINKKNIGMALQACLDYVLEFPERNSKENLFVICENKITL